MEASESKLFFNGINGETGEYNLPPMTAEELAGFIQGERPPENLNELRFRYQQRTQTHLGVKEGVDPTKIEESGWGVIFAHDADPAVKDSLGELFDHRREQAGEYFKIYEGRDGHRPDDSKGKFLARHGAAPGPADPEKVPYYLLIVGDPQRIPYLFQSQLDVQYAVGRIHFDTIEEYANYARSVVEAERGGLKLAREVAFLSTANPDDAATRDALQELVVPVSSNLAGSETGWQINTYLREEASKSQMARLLGGDQTPAFLFSSNQGLWLPNGSERQLSQMGALISQEWPGPEQWREPIPQDFYFAGDDLIAEANLLGLIAFFFSCYSVGTPFLDDFARKTFKGREEIAPYAFSAQLPSRMLGHPRGGALAVIGHVERVWGFSYLWPGAGRQTEIFESTMRRLLKGHPVGSAVEYFNDRYAELATVLTAELEEIEFGKIADPYELSSMWGAHNDARGYAILGDPAVRLPVAGMDEESTGRPVIDVQVTAGSTGAETESVEFESPQADYDDYGSDVEFVGSSVEATHLGTPDYESAPLETESSDAIDSPPEALDSSQEEGRRVWWFMADGTDEAQHAILDSKEFVTWGANGNTRKGDIVLMYQTSPIQNIAYLFLAQEDAHKVEKRDDWPWEFAIELADKVALGTPLPRTAILAHPGFVNWSLAKNPQGAHQRVNDIRQEGYWEQLRSLLAAWNPNLVSTLAEWENITEEVINQGVLDLAHETADMIQDSPGGITGDPNVLLPLLNMAIALAPEDAGLFSSRASISVNAGKIDAAKKDLDTTVTVQAPEGQSQVNFSIQVQQFLGQRAAEEPPPRRGRLYLDIQRDRVRLSFHQDTGKLIPYVSKHNLDKVELDALEIDSEFQEYGQQLFERLFPVPEGEDDKLAESAQFGYQLSKSRGRNRFDIELFIDPFDAELHQYLWEYMLESSIPLAVREGTPFYRRIYGGADPPPVSFSRLKVLVAICNPASLGSRPYEEFHPLNESVERNAIEAALNPLRDKGFLEYKILLGSGELSATVENIRETLQDGYHVLHILSHGFHKKVTDEETGQEKEQFFLIMEKEHRQADLVKSKDFQTLLLGGKQLRLVVLAACQSAGSNTEQTLRGLAPRLVRELEIPAVVAMQRKISDRAARSFATYFYEDLLRSGQVHKAMAATRLAMYQIDERRSFSQRTQEWGIPVLYLGQHTDGQILIASEEFEQTLQKSAPRKMPAEMSPNQLATEGHLERPLDEVVAQAYDQGGAAAMLASMVMASPTIVQAEVEEQFASGQERNNLSAMITGPVRIDWSDLKAYVAAQAQLDIRELAYKQIAAALNAGKHVILTGPPGTGKTSLAQAIGEFAAGKALDNGTEAGAEPTRAPMSAGTKMTTATADWTTFDTIGGYVPTRQRTLQFRPGILLQAVRDGQWLVIDEINRAEIDKSFGELFTLLSGQPVDLPYQVGDQTVRILPAKNKDAKQEMNEYLDAWWPEEKPLGQFDYVIHPNWRIIGTMNVYDRSFLFAMSLAFMRRFAFIDLGLPEADTYQKLCRNWLARELIRNDQSLQNLFAVLNRSLATHQHELSYRQMLQMSVSISDRQPDLEANPDEWINFAYDVLGQQPADDVKTSIVVHFDGGKELLNPDTSIASLAELSAKVEPLHELLVKLLKQESELMQRRGIGPAIALDMIRYAGERYRDNQPSDGFGPVQVFSEAFLLYVVPQLDGLDQETILKIYGEIAELFQEAPGLIHDELLDSIRLLYIHIQSDIWTDQLIEKDEYQAARKVVHELEKERSEGSENGEEGPEAGTGDE